MRKGVRTGRNICQCLLGFGFFVCLFCLVFEVPFLVLYTDRILNAAIDNNTVVIHCLLGTKNFLSFFFILLGGISYKILGIIIALSSKVFYISKYIFLPF